MARDHVTDQQDPELLRAEILARVESARDPYDKAVWQLLLGDPDAGLTTIREGLPGLASGPPNLQFAQIAVLADDATAPAVAAAAIDDTVARFVPGDREYNATMLALIAGDVTLARRYQAELDAFAGKHDRLGGGQPSQTADISRGLLDGDAEGLTNGINALLGWHLRRARSRSDSFNSSRGVVSLDSIVALILGHRRGLRVPVQSMYRTARVPLLAIHLTEWHGRPLPSGMPIDVVTDLLAGPWLSAHGLAIEVAPPSAGSPVRTKRTDRTPMASPPADQARALQALQARIRLGGHPWQLASWSLMLGEARAGRAQLELAAADARTQWQDPAQPNPNIVREHFALALALGDEAGLREAIPALQTWLRSQDGRPWGIYAHAAGYLDLICDVVGGDDRSRPSRADVEQVIGPLSSVRVAAIALAERDAALFREGLKSVLTEHARTLERKSSPPPPICEPAVHLAAAARRLGVAVQVEARFALWPVPVEGARVPCDLLGRAVWSDLD